MPDSNENREMKNPCDIVENITQAGIIWIWHHHGMITWILYSLYILFMVLWAINKMPIYLGAAILNFEVSECKQVKIHFGHHNSISIRASKLKLGTQTCLQSSEMILEFPVGIWDFLGFSLPVWRHGSIMPRLAVVLLTKWVKQLLTKGWEISPRFCTCFRGKRNGCVVSRRRYWGGGGAGGNIYPMISVYLCGIGDMKNCPNSQ